jgi:hypothetical protein
MSRAIDVPDKTTKLKDPQNVVPDPKPDPVTTHPLKVPPPPPKKTAPHVAGVTHSTSADKTKATSAEAKQSTSSVKPQ